MTLDEQAQVIIDNLNRLIGDSRISGLSAYQAALKLGATEHLAEHVAERWSGPDPIP